MRWIKANIIPAYDVHFCKVVVDGEIRKETVGYLGRWVIEKGEVVEYLDETPDDKDAEIDRLRKLIETAHSQGYKAGSGYSSESESWDEFITDYNL